jgi:hypothetical protein
MLACAAPEPDETQNDNQAANRNIPSRMPRAWLLGSLSCWLCREVGAQMSAQSAPLLQAPASRSIGGKNRRLVRLWRSALPPGAPFNRLDLHGHAQIDVDPFVLVGVPAGKRYCRSCAVFGDTKLKILIVGSGRCRVPTGHKMLPEIHDPDFTHLTRPLPFGIRQM